MTRARMPRKGVYLEGNFGPVQLKVVWRIWHVDKSARGCEARRRKHFQRFTTLRFACVQTVLTNRGAFEFQDPANVLLLWDVDAIGPDLCPNVDKVARWVLSARLWRFSRRLPVACCRNQIGSNKRRDVSCLSDHLFRLKF